MSQEPQEKPLIHAKYYKGNRQLVMLPLSFLFLLGVIVPIPGTVKIVIVVAFVCTMIVLLYQIHNADDRVAELNRQNRQPVNPPTPAEQQKEQGRS